MSDKSAATAIWFVPDPSEHVWADWASDSGLYHRGTGETHLLDALSAEAVRQLYESPQPLSRLSGLLAAECAVKDGPEWQKKIAGILQDLHVLHIVESSTRWPDSPRDRIGI
jgi:PqqD family protein of HPr-rel-A system